MTASNRLFRWVARWFMRIEAAGNILRIMLFGGTFLTTGLSALKQYGHDQYALPFIGAVGAGTLVFAYVYAEMGVYNQKNRDSADVGDNYSGPTMLFDGKIRARQLAYLGYVLENGNDKSIEEIHEQMQELTEEQWLELRDGADIEKLQGEQQ